MKTISIFLSFFLAGLHGRFAIKIAMMPLFIQRHFLVFSKLGEELGRKGHEVIVFVGDQVANYTNGQKMVQFFNTHNSTKIIDFVKGRSFSHGMLPFAEVVMLHSLQKHYCNDFLNDKQALNELTTVELLVGDSIYPCSALAAAKFRIPHVVAETPLSTPSYAQEMLAKFDRKTHGFLDNLQYYINRLGIRVQFYGSPIYSEVKAQHSIKLEETIQETLAKRDLFLLERNFTDYKTIPQANVKTVGRLLPGPDQAFSAELEAFVSSSDYGIILVSIHSAVDSEIKKVLEKAFAEVPQKIILKTTDKYDMAFSSNVKIVERFPQSILGHSKIKLLIADDVMTDVVVQAAHNAVPMVWLTTGKEFGGESPVGLLKDAGLGELLDSNNISVGHVVGLIQQVTLEKRYKEKAIQFARFVNPRPRTPLQEAAEIIENVHSSSMGSQACLSGTEGLGSSHNFLDIFVSYGILLTLVSAVVKRVIEIWHSQKTKTS